jgi:hypothetical protein
MEEKYIEILLRCFLDKPKYFKSNLIREQKKLENNYVGSNEFFERCKDALSHLENILESQLNERATELNLLIKRAETKTSNFSPKNYNAHLSYYEQCKEHIVNYQNELKGLSRNNFFINLFHLTNGKFRGYLTNGQIVHLKKMLIEVVQRDKKEIVTPSYTNRAWFEVGLLFVKGEMIKLLEKLDYNATAVAKELYRVKWKRYRPYISESLSAKGSDKNIFSSKKKIRLLIEYCEKNNITISPDFYNRILPSTKISTETVPY